MLSMFVREPLYEWFMIQEFHLNPGDMFHAQLRIITKPPPGSMCCRPLLVGDLNVVLTPCEYKV